MSETNYLEMGASSVFEKTLSVYTGGQSKDELFREYLRMKIRASFSNQQHNEFSDQAANKYCDMRDVANSVDKNSEESIRMGSVPFTFYNIGRFYYALTVLHWADVELKGSEMHAPIKNAMNKELLCLEEIPNRNGASPQNKNSHAPNIN